MINSLFDKKFSKKFDKIAIEKAKLKQKEKEISREFLTFISSQAIYEVLDIVDANGHPDEKRKACILREKYDKETLEFEDIMILDGLYKSNCQQCSNKGDDNE